MNQVSGSLHRNRVQQRGVHVWTAEEGACSTRHGRMPRTDL